MNDKGSQHDIPLITIERYNDDSDDEEEDDDDSSGELTTRQRLLRKYKRKEEEEEEDEPGEVVVRTLPTPAPRTSRTSTIAPRVPVVETRHDPSDSASRGASEPPLPPREPTAAVKAGTAGLVSPPRPDPPTNSTYSYTLPPTPSRLAASAATRSSRSSPSPKPRTSSSSLSAASPPSTPVSPEVPYSQRARQFFASKRWRSASSSSESAPPLPPKNAPTEAIFKSHHATPNPSSSSSPVIAARARRVPPTTRAAARALRAVPPAPDRDSVTEFPLLPDKSLYEPILRRRASEKDEYLDTNDLKALVHTELPSTRRRKTLVTEKIYAETGPYYRLTKAAAATFGWLSNTRDDYDVTQPIEENEADSQDDLRVWDLAETILHKDDMFAPQSSEPAESETSGGSRASSLRTFSDRMRRMTCTYEPNTDLHTRMVVRRASINRRESMRRDTAVEGYSAPRYRRDTAVEGYSAPKSSSLATHRLSKPRAFVRPYAVASIVGLKERAPSPLTLDDIGSGRDFIEDGGDVERGEGGGFVGPAAYDPVSPDATDFADKTQVMLLR